VFKFALFRNNAIFLVGIVAIAISLSILSYQYFAVTSNQIIQIASEDIRSNARTEANDISHSLENEMKAVISNLYILAHSTSVLSHQYEKAHNIIDAAQNSTNHLTDFYMWLDEKGKIIWISNINGSTYQKYNGFDLSYRPYFNIAKSTHKVYYSSTIESNDNVPRLYISYPLSNNSKSASNTGQTVTTDKFDGVMVAGIRITSLGYFLENQLLPESKNNMGLLDKKGIILYSDNSSYIGKYVLGDEFQHTLSGIVLPSSESLLNRLFEQSLLGNTGSGDIPGRSGIYTIVYQPVKIDGNYFLTSYILAPHNLASNVGNLVNQQKNFSIFIIIIITVAAIVVAFFVLSWNRRLKAIIISKTEELRTSNVSLIDTNKQLAKANDELKNHDIIQKEFINIAAHELRTPIQPILGLSGLLLRDKQTEKKRQELLEIVFRNAKRLERLTDDILDITRIESKSLKLKMELFNLSEMLRDVISDFQNQIDKGQIARANRKLEFIGLDEDIFVKADKDRIHQVISNLLSNAIKFTNEGEVTISVTKFDDRTVVSVKDAGSGIDPKILPKLFTKFATKSGSGTGLGLFISKNIVEAHGGNMWGKNNANEKGATFSFSLPSESD